MAWGFAGILRSRSLSFSRARTPAGVARSVSSPASGGSPCIRAPARSSRTPSPSFAQAGQLAEPQEQQALISGEGVREDDHRNQRRRVLLEDVVEAEVLTPPLPPLTNDLPRTLR